MAERRLRPPEDVAREARRLAVTAAGVDRVRLADIGSRMPVGQSTFLALLASGVNGRVGAWATRMYANAVDVQADQDVAVLTAAGIGSACEGQCYGILANDLGLDIVVAVLRASGADPAYERWSGTDWQPVTPDMEPVGNAYVTLAGDALTDALGAVTAGHGLVLRAGSPKAFLPRRVPLTAAAGAVDGVYAAVDEADTTAVLNLFRVADGTVQTRDAGEWVPDRDLLVHLVAAGVPLALIPAADVPVTLRQADDYDAVFPVVAAADAPTVAGLAVRAADTGRILMLQRALTDDDPAAGTWEFPGGHLEPGESPMDGAAREWSEETGCELPAGETGDSWTSPDGVYQGIVYHVPDESSVPIHDGRDDVINPDDPDGDQTESLAWWDPDHLDDNPSVRPELAQQIPDVKNALGETDQEPLVAAYLTFEDAMAAAERAATGVVPDLQDLQDVVSPGETGTPDFSTGVMVALPLDPNTAQQLAVPGGLDPADMHVTLAYLGDQNDLPIDMGMDGLLSIVQDWAQTVQPLLGEVSGPATFEGTDNADNPVQVALVDIPGLNEARQSLVDSLAANGLPVASDHGYTPHITRAYGPDPVATDGLGGTALTFDQVGVWHGTDQRSIPLGAVVMPVVATFDPSEKRDPAGQWTSGGAAQANKLESTRKSSAPKAAPAAKMVIAKPYHKPAGGGGGGGGGGKVAAAKKAAAKKLAAKKGAAANAVQAEQHAAAAAEHSRHTEYETARAAEYVAEQQRRQDFQQALAGMTGKTQRAAAQKRESARRGEWSAKRGVEAATETQRHMLALIELKRAKLAEDKALAKKLAAMKAAAEPEPVLADAVAHTRTPAALERFWVHGPGAAKIRWGAAKDWYRCVAQLSKYVHNPHMVKGQCNSLHKIATGMWPATHDKLLHGGN
jgi:8-oxo-dGTP pyrophosphatase MutT (NUDIX family)/2'-5' RNA ligase